MERTDERGTLKRLAAFAAQSRIPWFLYLTAIVSISPGSGFLRCRARLLVRIFPSLT